MWDDVIIGKLKNHCSAIKVFEINENLCNTNISENSDEYWINGSILGLSGKITKDSKEGLELSRLIKEEQESIDLYISTIFLKNINPQVIERKIENIKTMAFEEGYNEAKLEIREVIGISNN